MAIDIIIVSGFLGAGKTSLIQKWLQDGALHGRVAIIENDFGEIGVDAALLRSGEVTVSELNSGCICCSLSGDFVRALLELITRYAPDTILIEPSGVGMLSDVRKACVHPSIQPFARMLHAVTVVDIKRMNRYLENFGAFYEDQIRRADVIVFSRVEQYPERIADAMERVISLNPTARVFSEPWNTLPSGTILTDEPPMPEKRLVIGRRFPVSHNVPQRQTTGELFQTVTIHTDHVFALEALHKQLLAAEQSCEILIRAKGVLRSPDGYYLVQYTEGETQLEPSLVQGGFLCLIGRGLDAQRIKTIFEES